VTDGHTPPPNLEKKPLTRGATVIGFAIPRDSERAAAALEDDHQCGWIKFDDVESDETAIAPIFRASCYDGDSSVAVLGVRTVENGCEYNLMVR
jgi:hypothetical protein